VSVRLPRPVQQRMRRGPERCRPAQRRPRPLRLRARTDWTSCADWQ
jgi:hypothetical protein